ncbi:MAG: MbnH family di-heme enzyme [Pseudomonadota bacterium]
MRVITTLLTAVAAVALFSPSQPSRGGEYAWQLPPWIAPPNVPETNPMSDAKVLLGRRLFYDIRLSGPGYMACATCHKLDRALTDGRRVAVGATGERHTLNTPQLANTAYQSVLTMGDPTVHSFEMQALRPLFGAQPIEMGARGYETRILQHLAFNPIYADLFRQAFPDSNGAIDFGLIAKALAAFQRTMVSANAPFDRFRFAGDASALSPSAIRGKDLFFGPRLGCGRCHAGLHLTDAIPNATYHNTGLYNMDGKGGLPPGRRGLIDTTGRQSDMGRFKTPSLRNVTLTAPYMHDGSIATLDRVIDHYAAGGRSTAEGKRSPLTSPLIQTFTLSARERRDLLAFLASLTDDEFINNESFKSPFR